MEAPLSHISAERFWLAYGLPGIPRAIARIPLPSSGVPHPPASGDDGRGDGAFAAGSSRMLRHVPVRHIRRCSLDGRRCLPPWHRRGAFSPIASAARPCWEDATRRFRRGLWMLGRRQECEEGVAPHGREEPLSDGKRHRADALRAGMHGRLCVACAIAELPHRSSVLASRRRRI